jgi:hypothetical protein
MKKFVFAFLGCLFLALSSSIVLADSDINSNSSVNMSTVLQQLEQQGYYRFKKIEYEDGTYEVKAHNVQGQKVKIHYKYNNKPNTLSISKSKQDSQQLTMLEAVQKAEAAGYLNIDEVEFEHGRYEIEGFNKSGVKVKLYVDPKTGNITKKYDSWD